MLALFTFLISNSHSLKLEETAKGVRISVQVYTNGFIFHLFSFAFMTNLCVNIGENLLD
jgi:hypothetical protein